MCRIRDVILEKTKGNQVTMLNCCLETKKGIMTFSEREIRWPEKDFEGNCAQRKVFSRELRSHHALLLERETETRMGMGRVGALLTFPGAGEMIK